MEPLISIRLPGNRTPYPAGGELEFLYQIDADNESEITAVEAAVLWYTEGKGDEDMSVHFFERRAANGRDSSLPLSAPRHLRVRLPLCPVTYEGIILKIRWCVRIRVFLASGKQVIAEQTFRLGKTPPARAEPQPFISPGT